MNTTTAPVAAGTPAGPEFVDAKGLFAMFGIKPGLAYDLIKRRAIKSVCIRQPGKTKGKRLFYAPSVRTYLETLIVEQSGTNPQ